MLLLVKTSQEQKQDMKKRQRLLHVNFKDFFNETNVRQTKFLMVIPPLEDVFLGLLQSI